MKKLYLVICIALAMLGATSCSKADTTTSTKFDESTLKDRAIQVAEGVAKEENLSTIDQEDVYQQFSDNYGEDIASSYKSFYDTTKDLGKYKSSKVTDTKINEDTASVEVQLQYSDEKVIVKCNFDKDVNVTSFSSELYRTLGQKMVKALLNTVMGMGTVFVVLIFISLIIGLLKFVPALLSKKEVKPQDTAVVETVSEPVVEEELVDDGELVAVITAAIMASMGDQAPEDGLVVRSIRKINNKWKNA